MRWPRGSPWIGPSSTIWPASSRRRWLVRRCGSRVTVRGQRTERHSSLSIDLGSAPLTIAQGVAPNWLIVEGARATGQLALARAYGDHLGKLLTGQEDPLEAYRAARRELQEELGLDPQNIMVEEGDTDTAPYGLGTYASRSTPVAGAALVFAHPGRTTHTRQQVRPAHRRDVSPQNYARNISNVPAAIDRGDVHGSNVPDVGRPRCARGSPCLPRQSQHATPAPSPRRPQRSEDRVFP